MRRLFCIIVILLFLGAGQKRLLAAEYVTRITQLDCQSKFPTILARLSVEDSRGRPVIGLRIPDFKIVENRVPIVKFAIRPIPSSDMAAPSQTGEEYQIQYETPRTVADGQARQVVVLVDVATEVCHTEVSYTPGGGAVSPALPGALSANWPIFLALVALTLVFLFLPALWEWGQKVTKQSSPSSETIPINTPLQSPGMVNNPLGMATRPNSPSSGVSGNGAINTQLTPDIHINGDDLGVQIHEPTPPSV